LKQFPSSLCGPGEIGFGTEIGFQIGFAEPPSLDSLNEIGFDLLI